MNTFPLNASRPHPDERNRPLCGLIKLLVVIAFVASIPVLYCIRARHNEAIKKAAQERAAEIQKQKQEDAGMFSPQQPTTNQKEVNLNVH